MATKTINAEALVTILKDFDLTQFASLKAVTKPKLNKKDRTNGMTLAEETGCIADNIRKISEMVVGLGYEYAMLVKNRLINKEGKTGEEYDRGPSWHEPFEGSSTIHQHKTTHEKYLFISCIANNAPKSRYVDITTGAEIAREKLSGFLPVESFPSNQGLDDPIVVRTFKLESIRQMKVNGDTIEVV